MGDISPNVDALIAETGLSGRQVERLTNRIYGAPPKLLARKYRALRIASSLSGEGVDWQDLMGDAFYDQYHFIRECQSVKGQTPTQFPLVPKTLTRLMTARRRISGRVSPPPAKTRAGGG